MQPLAKNIWINGELIAWENATVHVMSHALHYGTSVFEGIRVYDTPNGPCGFRLTDHVRRLFDSARIYHFPLPFTEDELVQACKDVVRSEGLRSAYLRPLAFLGECGMGVSPSPENIRTDVMISAFPWGAYLGEEALEKGVDACISSWNRVAPNTIPAGAKAGGNYLSGYLIGREARVRGFGEGIVHIALAPGDGGRRRGCLGGVGGGYRGRGAGAQRRGQQQHGKRDAHRQHLEGQGDRPL